MNSTLIIVTLTYHEETKSKMTHLKTVAVMLTFVLATLRIIWWTRSNTKGTKTEPKANIRAIDERDAAMEYLNTFVRYHVLFRKGSKLTSAQVLATLKTVAPDHVRTKLIERLDVTREFKPHFRIGMEKRSSRIDGRHQKYWKDFAIVLD